MIATRLFFIGLLLSSAAFAQTPGIGDTRPTPPSLDEQRGPVGAGTGKEPAPVSKQVSRCDKVADAQREQCLRDERNAASGDTRRAEPATAPPPQNPR
jgi:hypothetical protein